MGRAPVCAAQQDLLLRLALPLGRATAALVGVPIVAVARPPETALLDAATILAQNLLKLGLVT
eukprot:3123422-Lingulodinium_polyedra.AAC.1